MKKIKLITDSLSDMPKELADKFNVTVLPLTVRFGTEEYKDGVDLSRAEFYKKLKEVDEIPQTAQVTPVAFKKAIEEAFSDGYETVIVINGSGEVSGTHNSALIAKEELSRDDVYVFDSRSLSYGCGMIVTRAAEMIAEDNTLDEILDRIRKMTKRTQHIFSVNTLKYLHKNGRLTTGQMALGTLLNVKPILGITEGKVEPIDKVRGNKKLYKRMIEICIEKGLKKGERISIGHAVNEDGLEKLKEIIVKELEPSEIVEIDIGCTIGTHTGAGVLAIFFIGE